MMRPATAGGDPPRILSAVLLQTCWQHAKDPTKRDKNHKNKKHKNGIYRHPPTHPPHPTSFGTPGQQQNRARKTESKHKNHGMRMNTQGTPQDNTQNQPCSYYVCRLQHALQGQNTAVDSLLPPFAGGKEEDDKNPANPECDKTKQNMPTNKSAPKNIFLCDTNPASGQHRRCAIANSPRMQLPVGSKDATMAYPSG